MKACILSVSGPELTESERSFLRDAQPWAIILMGRSCVSKDQIRKLIDDIWLALDRACLVFIDQEGGRVARLKPPIWKRFPPVAEYGALYQRDKSTGLEACKLGHYLLGSELSALGIHADCSPVADLTIPGAHEIIGDRSFGRDADSVGALGKAAIEGLHEAGVASVIKHIPGHGRAKVDSHDELPVINTPQEELAEDFAAFQHLTHAPMAMTAHILYTAIDANNAATLSVEAISGVIRKRIGFDGLLMSDDLGMQALGGSLGERARRAILAGCDINLHCAGFKSDPDVILREMEEVALHTPDLAGKASIRADAAMNASCYPVNADISAIEARYNALMKAEGAFG